MFTSVDSSTLSKFIRSFTIFFLSGVHVFRCELVSHVPLLKNKGISTIAYNHLNLPKLIAKGDDAIQYVYDANGTKLQKILKKGGAVIKTTSYIGDLVYEGTTDKFLNTEEGRVVLMENGQSKEEYQYHLKDHLGNVRVTFTTADKEELTNLYMATMEPEFSALEESTFNNLETRQVDQLHNKTEGGKASARLNAAEGKAVGPSMSLKVMAGDTVKMKVFAQYHDKAKTKDAIEGMTSMVASAFTPKGAPAEAATIVTQTLRQPLGGAGRLALFAKDNTIPKAYLNYLFFDKDMNYKTGGFKQVSEEGLGQFEELSLEFAPEEEGLLMVYTANQTAENLNVYFDQMTVAHTSGPIVRVDDYYPFGMTFNTGELAGALTNKYLYQGQEVQNELGLGWYQFKWRMHDPAIGRFISVDPLASDYVHNSPYAFSENKVTGHVELEGLEAVRVPRGRASGGNQTAIRRTVQEASRIVRTPNGIAGMSRREGAMFRVHRTYSVSRGNGNQSINISPSAGTNENPDNTHSFGTRGGNIAKVAAQILDDANKIVVSESFTEAGVTNKSLGSDYMVDNAETTKQLQGLQNEFDKVVGDIARGDLSPEEFSKLSPEEQNLRISFAKVAAGASPTDLIEQKVDESKMTEEKREEETMIGPKR